MNYKLKDGASSPAFLIFYFLSNFLRIVSANISTSLSSAVTLCASGQVMTNAVAPLASMTANHKNGYIPPPPSFLFCITLHLPSFL